MTLADILETAMILSFGISWPLSLIRSWRSRTARGKSLAFCVLVFFGYICGITGKTLSHNFNLAYTFYWLNLVMVGSDICLWFRNHSLDKKSTATGK